MASIKTLNAEIARKGISILAGWRGGTLLEHLPFRSAHQFTLPPLLVALAPPPGGAMLNGFNREASRVRRHADSSGAHGLAAANFLGARCVEAAASLAARRKISVNIARVSFPVCVF